MISHTNSVYRESSMYYAEASTYIDAMDYIEFKAEDGWSVLIAPFVVQVERVPVQNEAMNDPDWIEYPIMWGFALHRFNIKRIG